MQINGENPSQIPHISQYAPLVLHFEKLQQYIQLTLGSVTKFMARYV